MTQQTFRAIVFAFVLVSPPAAGLAGQSEKEHAWRWYSRGGLQIEVRDDWTVPADAPWTFRSTRGLGQISFNRWLPIRSSQYSDFDEWVARQLVNVKGLHEVSTVTPGTVSGFRAMTYTGRDGTVPSKPAIRETWIGVPDPPGGVIFSTWMSTTAQGRELDDTLQVHDRMLATMRLHPAALDTHTGGKWTGPLPEGSHTNPYRASVVDVAAWLGDVGGARPVIEVDPRILVTGGRGVPSVAETLHPPAALVGVSLDNMVVVMTPERARQCTGIGARTCRTDGRFVAVAFDTVVVTGDTATVNAFVRVSRATLMKLTLTRRNTLWSVVNRTIIGQT